MWLSFLLSFLVSFFFFFLLPSNLVQVWLYTHGVHAVDGLFVDQLQGYLTFVAFLQSF